MAKKSKKKSTKKETPSSSIHSLNELAQRVQRQYDPLIKATQQMQRLVSQSPLASVQHQISERIKQYEHATSMYNQGKIPSISSNTETATYGDELSELKKFVPIELNRTTQEYIDKLFDNMGANSGFFNNAVLNLSHFYIFCLHCLMIKIYRHEERFKHLKYLKETIKEFTRKLNDANFDSPNFDHSIFNGIEREAIVFLFHYLKIDSHSHIFRRNKDIFDSRNEIAHFNEKVFSHDSYEDVRSAVELNLKELSDKAYIYTKESISSEISDYTKNRLIDDENYISVFEEINQKYYVTYYDYEMLSSRLTSSKPKPNYYILKYAAEQLNIE